MGQAPHEAPIQVRLIATIVRGEDPAVAWRIARLAADGRPYGIVGLDLAGDELRAPLEPLIPIFRWARERGLFLTIHAGEVGPPAHIRHAVLVLGAHRIGHGIQAVRDPAVLRLLRERGIPLEVCPTSNLHTGAAAGFHPPSVAGPLPARPAGHPQHGRSQHQRDHPHARVEEAP